MQQKGETNYPQFNKVLRVNWANVIIWIQLGYLVADSATSAFLTPLQYSKEKSYSIVELTIANIC